MKKEALIAIFIGLSLGLIITYGVYQAQQTLSKPPAPPVVDSELTPTPKVQDPESLSLHSPEDETLQADQAVTIAGTTLPNSYVVIFIGNDETITTADQSGNFSLETELENGSNVITVYTINEDGETRKAVRTVVVSKQFVEEYSTNNEIESTNNTQE